MPAAQVIEIDDRDPRLQDVLALWRQGRKYLGPMPDAGFADRARQGTLLIAEFDGQTVGYVLYDLPADRAKLVHLCVAGEARNQGVARLLVGEVSKRHRERAGVQAHCRTDFPADKLWPQLGFRPVNTRRGRSKAGHELTIWLLDHGNPDLFTELPQRLELAVLDSNTFEDLATPRPQGEATLALQDDFVQERVELAITNQVHLEIHDCKDKKLKQSLHEHASGFRTVTEIAKDESWEDLVPRVAEYCPRAGDADHRHVAVAVAVGATYLITRDEGLLEGAGAVGEEFGLRVVRPEGLIARIDQLMRRDEYEPRALQATKINAVRGEDVPEADLVRAFLNHGAGEKAADYKRLLRAALSSTDGRRFQVFRSPDGRALGCLVYHPRDDHIEVSCLRVASAGKLGRALARQVVYLVRLASADRALPRIVVTDPHPTKPLLTALEQEGFSLREEGWVCELRLGFAAFHEIIDGPVAEERVTVANAERSLWPIKILSEELPTFIVAIEAAWAGDLFDSNLAAGTLLARNTELGLSREHIYYRSPGASGGIAAPARLLWYVKGDGAGHPIQCVRAVSHLTEVTVGRPATLHQRFERLGVWTLPQIRSAASGDGLVMAMRFTNTELFPAPLTLDGLRRVWHDADSTFTAPQSPRRIPERMFRLVYQRASAYVDSA